MLKYEEVILLFRGRYNIMQETIKFYNSTSNSLVPFHEGRLFEMLTTIGILFNKDAAEVKVDFENESN